MLDITMLTCWEILYQEMFPLTFKHFEQLTFIRCNNNL